jgi:hypothetical protein
MAHCVCKWADDVSVRWEEGAPGKSLALVAACLYYRLLFPLRHCTKKKSMWTVSFPMSAAPWKTVKGKRKLMRGTRTCCALRRRLAFPPYVLIVVVVHFPVLIVFVAIAIVLHRRGWASSFLPRRRRRRCSRHPFCCVTDGCTWMTDTVGAEPFAVWDGCQGRREARVMIWFIALRAEMSTATSDGGEIEI